MIRTQPFDTGNYARAARDNEISQISFILVLKYTISHTSVYLEFHFCQKAEKLSTTSSLDQSCPQLEILTSPDTNPCCGCRDIPHTQRYLVDYCESTYITATGLHLIYDIDAAGHLAKHYVLPIKPVRHTQQRLVGTHPHSTG